MKRVLCAWLVAGTLDIADAIVFIGWIKGAGTKRVLQFIASGLLGVRAFQGGWTSAMLGLDIHFFIALCTTLTYYRLSRKFPVLLKRWAVYAPIYGLGVFFFMHYGVVPLSRAPKQGPASIASLANLIFSHVFFMGLTMAGVLAGRQRITTEVTEELTIDGC